ncbi:MAG: hypothetical protein ACK42D_02990 [Candidatus Paceibacteria bacterium]
MKKFYIASVFALILLPALTFAGAEVGGELNTFLGAVIGFINRVLVPFALAIAFIFFVWGVVKYFVIGGDSDDGKSKGKDMIIYSVVAFVVIFSFYGIVNLLTGGLGLGGGNLDQGDIPNVPVRPGT